MPTYQDVTFLLKQNTRNNIVFCRENIEGIRFINVGMEMSRIIEDKPEEVDDPAKVYKQVLGQSDSHGYIGLYLAIENIGILFEPELKLDVRSIIDTYSKNQCLIIRTDAEIADGKLFFLRKDDGKVVDLQGLAYLLLEK